MFAVRFDRSGEAQDVVFVLAGRGDDLCERGSALGQRAGLVDGERVDFLQPLQRLRIADENPEMRAAPHADHDRHRRGESERAGARDDEHGHGIDQRIGIARLGPEHDPRDEGDDGARDDGGDEPARDGVGHALDRRAAALGRADHLHNAREQRVVADFLRLHEKTSRAVDRAARDGAARFFFHRNRLAGDHRFIHRASAFEHAAIDRDFLAGPDAQAVTGMDLFQRHIGLGAVVGNASRGLGREAEQRFDCASRRGARLEVPALGRAAPAR